MSRHSEDTLSPYPELQLLMPVSSLTLKLEEIGIKQQLTY